MGVFGLSQNWVMYVTFAHLPLSLNCHAKSIYGALKPAISLDMVGFGFEAN
jgi:hypothetical protein